MDGRYTWAIQEIIADPRYREFAAFCTGHGKQVVPDGYPWRHMGMGDDAFLALDLRYEEGKAMPMEAKREQLGVLREQERLVVTWWHWWPGLEVVEGRKAAREPVKESTPKVVPAKPRPAGVQGLLFEA